MKSLKTISLSLPEPCTEDWAQMKPNGCGRFCGQCEKTVIDFTLLSDEQIGRLFAAASGKQLCGRFTADQLDRPIVLPMQRKEGWWLHRAAALLLIPCLQPVSAPAQETQQTTIKQQGSDTTAITICISGSIKDALTGEPLTRMEIRIDGMEKQYSDRKGHFSFTLPARYAGRKITISAGYQPLSAPVAPATIIPEETLTLDSNHLNYTVQLLRYPMIEVGKDDPHRINIQGYKVTTGYAGIINVREERTYPPRRSFFKRITAPFKRKNKR